MRRFKGFIKTDMLGSTCEFEFEVENEATVKEIEEEAREEAFNHVEWGFKEVESD